MKRPLLLAVAEGVAAFSALLEAAAAAGVRTGWLELGAAPAPTPPGLERAAAAGVLRAVAVGGGRVASLKPIRGEAVLDDLVREHFLGCALVLARGAENLVRLEAEGDGWRLTAAAAGTARLTTPELLENLRRPSFWRRLERSPRAGEEPRGDD